MLDLPAMSLFNRTPKPERPTIEFIALDPVAAEEFPPVPAGRAMASWLRHMPVLKDPDGPRVQNNATLKACPGILDYANEGFILPMWADIILKAKDEGFDIVDIGAVPADFQPIGGFNRSLIPGMPLGDHQHPDVLKFEMPWRMVTPEGWSTMLLQPWFHAEGRWEVIPGIVDHDHFHTLNIVALWNVPVGEEVLIKAGTPLCHLIPFQRHAPLKAEVSYDQQRWHEIGMAGRGGVKRIALGGYAEHRRRRRRGDFDLD